MEKKIIINEVKELAKKDGSGSYYVVKILLDSVAVEALCFDARIKTMTGEQTLDVTQKNDKYFINFPREGKASKPWGKSPAELNLQANSFAMAYAKDIVVALIPRLGDKDVTREYINRILFEQYRAIRKELDLAPDVKQPESTKEHEIEAKTEDTIKKTLKKEYDRGMAVKCPDTGRIRPKEDCDACIVTKSKCDAWE